MTTSDAATRIKQAVDILDLIGSVVPLRRLGTRYVGLCPFHREKTPSFQVDVAHGLFYCFGCGAGGDVITFAMRHWNLTFPEAVKALADRYHVPLPEEALGASKKKPEVLSAMAQVLELACEFFVHRLQHREQGGVAREYIAKRGLPPEVVQEQRLGYAPLGWDHLLRHLQSKGVDPDLAVRAGLAVRSDKGTVYDRFRHRLIFPITAPDGSLVAFGGRSLDGTEPKYLNSPETELYHKGRTLYQYAAAMEACRATRQVIVVEGYMDLLAFHARGFRRVVATLGTALTPHQVRLLQRLADEVVLVYDGDASGQKAMLRALPLFLRQGLAASCLTLPFGMDPDDYLKAHGLDAFAALLQTRRELLHFAVDAVASTWNGTSQDKVRVVKECADLVSDVQDPVLHEDMARLLGTRLFLSEHAVLQHFSRAPETASMPRTFSGSRTTAAKASSVHVPSAEETILRLIVQHPHLAQHAQSLGVLEYLEPSSVATVLEALLEQGTWKTLDEGSPADLTLPDEPSQTLWARLMMEKDENTVDENAARLLLEERIHSLRIRHERKKLEEIRAALVHADRSGDRVARKKLLEEYRALCAAQRRG